MMYLYLLVVLTVLSSPNVFTAVIGDISKDISPVDECIKCVNNQSTIFCLDNKQCEQFVNTSCKQFIKNDTQQCNETFSSTTTSSSTSSSTPTTTLKPTTTPVSSSTESSTIPPTSTTTPVLPKTTVAPNNRHFDPPSFIGGIVLALGLLAIIYVSFKFYKARTERNYRTL